MAKVRCNQCGHIIKVKVTDDILGKRIKFTCKNAACDNMITYKVPQQHGRDDLRTVFSDVGEPLDVIQLNVKPSDDHPESNIAVVIGKHTLGRHSENKKATLTIKTQDKSMSRLHCTIDVFRDKRNLLCCTIKDCGSQAGTMLNGKKLHDLDEYYLANQDEIQLGKSILTFEPTIQS